MALSFFVLLAIAQRHTEFVHLPLTLTPEEMVQKLQEKGLQLEDSCELSGHIAGMKARVIVKGNKDTTACSYVMVTTQEQRGTTQHADYIALMKWLRKLYGAPTWESTVRSHPFARWFIDFDHDIVLISKANTATEVWFYEDHHFRDYDYYAILKCCERLPADDVPFFTAQEQVTWENKPVVLPKPNVSKKQKKSRKHHKAKHHKKRRKK